MKHYNRDRGTKQTILIKPMGSLGRHKTILHIISFRVSARWASSIRRWGLLWETESHPWQRVKARFQKFHPEIMKMSHNKKVKINQESTTI